MFSSRRSRAQTSIGPVLRVGVVLWCALIAGNTRGQTRACSAGAPFKNGTALIRAIRVYTGADGVSHIEETAVKGFTVPFFKTGDNLTETVLGPSHKVVLVHGPANASIPLRSGIGRVMFLTLAGSSTVVLPSGEEATAYPGDLAVFDDAASKTGHAGRTGECGYVAISIPIPPDAPTFAEQR